MKLNLKYNFIYIFLITLFFFLWDASLNNIIFISENYNIYTFNYLIVILLVPILFNFINNNKYSIYNVLLKNYQSYPTKVIVQAYKTNTWENKIIDGKMLPVFIKDRYIELSPNNIYYLIDALREAEYKYYESCRETEGTI